MTGVLKRPIFRWVVGVALVLLGCRYVLDMSWRAMLAVATGVLLSPFVFPRFFTVDEDQVSIR